MSSRAKFRVLIPSRLRDICKIKKNATSFEKNEDLEMRWKWDGF